MAFFYTEEQKALLCKLINEANPRMVLEPRTLDNTRLGPPLTYAPQEGEIANTRMMVFSLPGHTFVGKQEFKYRRINMGSLFNHMILEFDHWLEQDTIDRTILCDWINQRYQLNLVPEDMEDSTWPSGGGTHSVNILPSSYNFQGSLLFKWDKNKRKLDQIIVNKENAGRIWDTRHEGEEDTRPLMTLVGFRGDYTTFLNNLQKITTGMAVDDIKEELRPMVERFNALFETELSVDIPHTEVNGLGGLTVLKPHLPSSVIPEADSEFFNKVLTIPSQADSWFGGSVFFHHNDFTITSNVPDAKYGDSITFTVHQDHAQSGVMYYWTMDGNLYEPDMEYLGRGSLMFNGPTAKVTVTLPPFTTSQRGGKIRLQLRRQSIDGHIVEVSDDIDIHDPAGQKEFTNAGVTDWVIPEGVYEICAVVVGGGGGGGGNDGGSGNGSAGGGGGGLRWRNAIPVTPGEVLRVQVGTGGAGGGYYSNGHVGAQSYLYYQGNKILWANGGGGGVDNNDSSYGGGNGGAGGISGPGGTSGGGRGGEGSRGFNNGGHSGGGGAGGYSGNGGRGNWQHGSGGGGAGGSGYRGGGGVGLHGEGPSGDHSGDGGSGGYSGSGKNGGRYGGGGVGIEDDTRRTGGNGGQGGVRIIWGYDRAYPAHRTEDIIY